MEAELERVEQAGADEGRLAAARSAEHGEEMRRRERVDHLVDAAFAAEEDIELFPGEGSEPGIGHAHRIAGHERRSETTLSTFSGDRPSRRSSSSAPRIDMPTGGFSLGGQL